MGLCKSKIENDCPICFGEITYKNNYKTRCCKKNFHRTCITNWNKRNKSCPLCRKGIHITVIKVRRKRRSNNHRVSNIINHIY